MALDLKSAGTLARSRGWFSEPAPSLPELPWALQGEGHTRSPRRGGGGGGGAWGRSGACTRGTEGALGPRREVPGCGAPRGLSVNCLCGAVTFLPFVVLSASLPKPFLSLVMGVPPQVSGAAVEKQVSPGMSCRIRPAFSVVGHQPHGMFPCEGEGKASAM